MELQVSLEDRPYCEQHATLEAIVGFRCFWSNRFGRIGRGQLSYMIARPRQQRWSLASAGASTSWEFRCAVERS